MVNTIKNNKHKVKTEKQMVRKDTKINQQIVLKQGKKQAQSLFSVSSNLPQYSLFIAQESKKKKTDLAEEEKHQDFMKTLGKILLRE